jgi:hypothetical protein
MSEKAITFLKEGDVVLGRGGDKNTLRKGTLYQSLLMKHAMEYRELQGVRKRTFVIKNIVDPVHQAGGRFLYCCDTTSNKWVEMKINADIGEPNIGSVVMQAVRDFTYKRIKSGAWDAPAAAEDICESQLSRASSGTSVSADLRTAVGESTRLPSGPFVGETSPPSLEKQTSVYSQFTRTVAEISATLDPPPLHSTETTFSAISEVYNEPFLKLDILVENIGQEERMDQYGTHLQKTDTATANHLVFEPRLHQLEGIVETLENENTDLRSRLINLEQKYTFRNCSDV